MKEFDENQALKQIRDALPQPQAKEYTDDDLLNIIDMVYDYYELNGLLDIDAGPEEDEDLDIVSELTDYAKRMLKKDKACKIAPEHIEAIVRAELDYEESLGMPD